MLSGACVGPPDVSRVTQSEWKKKDPVSLSQRWDLNQTWPQTSLLPFQRDTHCRCVRKVCSFMKAHTLSLSETKRRKYNCLFFLNEDKLISAQSNQCKWRIKWILLQETFTVVLDSSCCKTLNRHSERGTPTQRIHFLWTCTTTTLCCSALVVIKNRPLSFQSKGPVASWSILCSTLIPKSFLGREVLPALQQLRAKGDSFLQGGRLLIDFTKAHKQEYLT